MANSRIEGVKDQAKETAASAGQTFQEVKGVAKEAAANVGQQAREYAAKAGDKAEDALHSVGQGMSSLAGTIRQSAPQGGTLASAAGTVAEKLDTGGRYLREHDFGDIGEDLSNVVRRYPIASLMCVFGIGVLMGGALRR
jgi:ABC-type transporter Mla subunit MlaD